MSELCTLAASVVLQSSASGTPGSEPVSLPSSEAAEPALIESSPEDQPSVGCDGHHAIAPSILPEPSFRPASELGAAIADEVEFSPSQATLVSQNPALQDPLVQDLGLQTTDHSSEIEHSKGYAPGAAQSESPFPIPLSRPLTTPETKPRKQPAPQQRVELGETHRVTLDRSNTDNGNHGATPTVDRLINVRPAVASSPVSVRQEIDWSNGYQSTLPRDASSGWPSLLYPQPQSDKSPSEPSSSIPSSSAPSHQSALPSTSDPGLAPAFGNGVLPSAVQLSSTSRPQSGRQLYQQRRVALSAGKTYTRLPSNSFEAQWTYASYNPTYEDWLYLLSREARSMASGQGNNALTVIVGDSLSLWMPTEFLPQHRFWLNQSISGETAAGMVKRLHMFDHTNPDTIHVMAGINDLKNGATDTEVLNSLQTMMQQLRYRHPGAEVIIHSILPTRLPHLPSDRIRSINQQLAYISQQEGTTFLDLQGYFSDTEGHLRQDLTTDGLHLNYQGYTLWQAAIRQQV